jgi:aryl-alcohol dehydrogenase-like predicted oxidoreductase
MIASGGFDSLFINLNVADVASREKVLPTAHKQGLAVNGREAFMKGELFKMGAEAGLTDRARLAQAALRWALAVPEVTCMVIGAAEPEHLERTLAVLDAPGLTAEDGTILERLRTSPLYQAFEAQRRREFLAEAPPTRI